jgi:membrane protease YdiL (CAAX protease family)
MVHFANFLNGTDYVTVITILTQVIYAIGMGFLWGIITVETKSIIPGIILHYLSNSLDSLWLYLPGASIEEQLLYKLLFAKIYPIILSILFVLIVTKSRKRRTKKSETNLTP